jgi:hypothetical protein
MFFTINRELHPAKHPTSTTEQAVDPFLIDLPTTASDQRSTKERFIARHAPA